MVIWQKELNKLDPSLPFPRSYWVIPGKFLAGAYPGSADPEEAKEKIKALISCGIRSVINLMEKDEVDSSGDLFSPYEEAFLEMGKASRTESDLPAVSHQRPERSLPTRHEPHS